MRMKVKVTAEHIAQGIPHLVTRCPIVLALRDAGYNSAAVNGLSVLLGGDYVALPIEAMGFVAVFDQHGAKAVKPFEFDLPINPAPDGPHQAEGPESCSRRS